MQCTSLPVSGLAPAMSVRPRPARQTARLTVSLALCASLSACTLDMMEGCGSDSAGFTAVCAVAVLTGSLLTYGVVAIADAASGDDTETSKPPSPNEPEDQAGDRAGFEVYTADCGINGTGWHGLPACAAVEPATSLPPASNHGVIDCYGRYRRNDCRI